MHHLTPTKLSKAVKTSQFDQVLNIHSGFIVCDMNYSVDFVHKGRKHSILMINGLRNESPAVYHDNDRLFVIEGSLLLEVKLNDTHDIDGVNLPYDLRRAVKMPQGVLICHTAGGVMMSDDLQEELWSIVDRRITDVVWRDGELRAFFGEHNSILLDPETGDQVASAPAGAMIEDHDADKDAIILQFPARRGH
jgi:hypothetical protein